ncbi:MAG: ERF family protein [Clostridia bacterium]|nr:ERF family protein [Clostridia bacterium]MBR4973571.1 ERF family protein [Clostridia bacterium]
MKRLIEIQKKLKAPKNQRNNFGNYNYRSCEDILEAVKPLLTEQKVALIIKDDVIAKDGRFYIKATATLFDEEGKEIASATAYAREEESKKGMDASQLTGSTSSYARKYALNGLFAIDDTKDADATNTHGKEEKPKPETITADDKALINGADECKTVEELENYYKEIAPNLSCVAAKKELIKRCKARKEELNG